MAKKEIIIPEVKPVEVQVVDGNALDIQNRGEIDVQIATAQRYPRDLERVTREMIFKAGIDEAMAEEMIYCLPKGGKAIEGPSIRFAEMVYLSYRNCRLDVRLVGVDRKEKNVTAQATFHDLETNVATRMESKRRISGKGGNIFNEDMIMTTYAAVASIARRNAILTGIDRVIWMPAYRRACVVLSGEAAQWQGNYDKAMGLFKAAGVEEPAIRAALGLPMEGKIVVTAELLVSLRGAYASLLRGEVTADELNGKVLAIGHDIVANPLDDEPKG